MGRGLTVKIIKFIFSHFEEVFSSLLIFIMSVFAFANVVSRYVISLPLNFTEELNVYFFVWLAFLGSALASLNGSHMAVSLIYNKFPVLPRKILYIVIQAITIIFFTVLFYCGWLEVSDEIAIGAMTETLEVPVWWFTGAIPVGSLLIIIRTIQKTIKDLRTNAY